MTKLILNDYGFYDILKDTKIDLESVLGTKVSKKRKDEIIHKALGVIDAIYAMTDIVTESDIIGTGAEEM